MAEGVSTDRAGNSSALLLLLLPVLSASSLTAAGGRLACCSSWPLGVLPSLPGLPSSSPSRFSWRLRFLRLAFLLGRLAGGSSSSDDSSDSLSDSSPAHAGDILGHDNKPGRPVQALLSSCWDKHSSSQGAMRTQHAGSLDLSWQRDSVGVEALRCYCTVESTSASASLQRQERNSLLSDSGAGSCVMGGTLLFWAGAIPAGVCSLFLFFALPRAGAALAAASMVKGSSRSAACFPGTAGTSLVQGSPPEICTRTPLISHSSLQCPLKGQRVSIAKAAPAVHMPGQSIERIYLISSACICMWIKHSIPTCRDASGPVPRATFRLSLF